MRILLRQKKNLKIEPTKILDCTGLFCPEPVYRTRQALDELSDGEILEVIADDPAAEGDLSSYTKRLQMQIVKIQKEGDSIHFFIKK